MPPGSGLQVRARAPHSPARARDCLPGRVREGRGSKAYVTEVVTIVNPTVTRNLRAREARYALLLPACGEKVGMRGRHRYTRSGGRSPSPARGERILGRHGRARPDHPRLILADLPPQPLQLHRPVEQAGDELERRPSARVAPAAVFDVEQKFFLEIGAAERLVRAAAPIRRAFLDHRTRA